MAGADMSVGSSQKPIAAFENPSMYDSDAGCPVHGDVMMTSSTFAYEDMEAGDAGVPTPPATHAGDVMPPYDDVTQPVAEGNEFEIDLTRRDVLGDD